MRPYLVMERLHGADLCTVLAERGPLPVAEAVDYVLQSCQAVAEAHALGIVHRDIKPENLFLCRGIDGRASIKVLDFGISKQLKSGRSLTDPSAGIGSPWYMSPEQMRRPELVDARSDIWSLGVVLFELLTGSTPFDGQSVAEVCAATLTRSTPSAAERVKAVPKRLDEVLERCLAKTRELRYESVAELAAALAPFGSGDAPERVQAIEATLGVSRRKTSSGALGRYRRNLAGLTLALLVVAGVASWFGLNHYRALLAGIGSAAGDSDLIDRAFTVELVPALPPVHAERELRRATRPARPKARSDAPSTELPPELTARPDGVETDDEALDDDPSDVPALAPLPELPRELLGEAP